MTHLRRLVLLLCLLACAPAAPAVAQIIEPPPSTQPPPTQPPSTQPPVTEPPATVAPPTTARPRSSTTRPGSTTTGVTTTTTIRLLPPPSVAPQDPSAAPVGSTQSDHISSVFVWLSILGFVTTVGLLVGQWFLTRPGRRGWTI
jgi:hypothetical protein